MQEFAFELALAAHLETRTAGVIGRQLGCHVHGRRIADLVCVEPGPEFDDRVAITPQSIPAAAIESDVGPGEFTFWKDAFDCHPERAEQAIESALERGFFERERRNGRTYVRQTVRYPDWFGRIVAIENKPDLDRPGDLSTQLLTDVQLGLVDAVVLATASHVTGAHRNRLPDAVGIWQFDPETDELSMLRDAKPLDVNASGIEIIERDSARTAIRVASAAEKAAARRRVAERAYGKGWRTFQHPRCTKFNLTEPGIPFCTWKDDVVHPASDCSQACPGFVANGSGGDAGDSEADEMFTDPPGETHQEVARYRASRTAWDPDAAGNVSRQTTLDRFV